MEKRRKRRSWSNLHGSEFDSGSVKKQKYSGSGQGLISYCSPSQLIETTKSLTPEQCDLIRRNGFGGLLKLRCRTNPPQLLYHWLAKHFNCSTSELVFSNGSIIPVTAKSVQHVLGIPHGNKKVKYRMDAASTAFMKHDYYSEGLPAKINSIAKLLSEMKKADDHFLRMYLLFALSCFLCPTTSSYISPRCFPSLVDISSVAQLDWCGFVLEQLVSSIKRYKHRLTIGGCMFFLAVHYLDHLDTGSYYIPDSIPRTVVWTSKVTEEVVNMDTISAVDGIYGKLRVKAIVSSTCTNSELKIPPIIGEGLTVEQFVSSHLAADCDPSVKGELCRVVNNFCTSATSLLSTFVGSFLKDFSGLIASSSNTIHQACHKPSHISSQATHADVDDEGSDQYYTEDETSVEDTSVSDDASEAVSEDEKSSSESHSDDASSHDDVVEESNNPHGSLDALGNELSHEQDGDDNDICKQEAPREIFPEVPNPPGYPEIPRIKQEPGSPASDGNLHQQYANGNPMSANVQQEPRE